MFTAVSPPPPSLFSSPQRLEKVTVGARLKPVMVTTMRPSEGQSPLPAERAN
jgi:hypothetical protein